MYYAVGNNSHERRKNIMKIKNFIIMSSIMSAFAIGLTGCGDFAVQENKGTAETEAVLYETTEKTEAPSEANEENATKVSLEKTEEKNTQDANLEEIKKQEERRKQLEAQEAENLRIQQEERARIEAAQKEAQAKAEAAAKEAAQKQQEEISRRNEEYKRKLEEYNAKVEAYNAKVSNYYHSDTPVELLNSVNLSPAHVIYGDDGALYALMYVYNGFGKPVYNIGANYIELYDVNGNLIARDENIGIGEGGALGAHSYATWTFVFSGDKLKIKDADLTKGLFYKSGTAYAS